MLPNVLLIVSMFLPMIFTTFCNLPFQLVSVLVILILEFHVSPLLLYSWPHSMNTLAISTLTRVLWTFSLTVFFIGNILAHSSSRTCVVIVSLNATHYRPTVPVLPLYY